MRRIVLVGVLVLPLVAAALAARTAPPAGGFAADFPAGGKLRVHVRSGDVTIQGGAEDRVTVSFAGANAGRAGEVAVHLARAGGDGELTIDGGPREDLRILLQVPSRLSLDVRMPAGSLAISGVTGDKDVRLHAGEMTIEVGDPSQYASLETSVFAGGITARPFAISKGGLFRFFRRTGSGAYRLHAHVGAGDLTLKN